MTAKPRPRPLAVIEMVSGGAYVVLPSGQYIAHDERVVTMGRVGIAKTETTTGQYLACVKSGMCSRPEWAEPGSRYNLVTGKDRHYAGFTHDEQPIVGVSWFNAQQFAVWMSRQNPGYTFRLPSETEWEYAAGSGDGGRWASMADDAGIKSYAWYGANSKGRTHPVGLKLPNAWGLLDMAGNVWEWVQDCHADRLVYRDARAYEGKPGRTCPRMVRGGAWNYPASYMALDAREDFAPISRNRVIGFRLALDIKGAGRATPIEARDAAKAEVPDPTRAGAARGRPVKARSS